MKKFTLHEARLYSSEFKDLRGTTKISLAEAKELAKLVDPEKQREALEHVANLRKFYTGVA